MAQLIDWKIRPPWTVKCVSQLPALFSLTAMISGAGGAGHIFRSVFMDAFVAFRKRTSEKDASHAGHFIGRPSLFFPNEHSSCSLPKGIQTRRIHNIFQSLYKFNKYELPSLKKLSGACCMSNLPENAVYGGPKSQSPSKRITLKHLVAKYEKREPITMVTAYDYPSAVHVDQAGIDICLVGDSAAMVVHGHDTTLPITLEEMLSHCRAVARGASRSFLVGDLPFGSYEEGAKQAVGTAIRMLKEGGMDAIKLEGGASSRIAAAKSIVEAGIAVMGHVGLTPQAISVLGGFRPQGRNVASALKVVDSALALQDVGCFSIVLECVPSVVAAAVTSALQIPTIGIGAGPSCGGQVLVYHDLLGMMQHPHHAKVTPKFCKQYGHVGNAISKALLEYRDEVVSRSFPSDMHTPYRIDRSDMDAFINELERRGLSKAARAVDATLENNEKAREPPSKLTQSENSE